MNKKKHGADDFTSKGLILSCAFLVFSIVVFLFRYVFIFGEPDYIRNNSRGTSLQFRVKEEIENLDPALFKSEADETVIHAVMEGLFRYRPNSTDIIPLLVESYSISNDCLEIFFKLREGVMWHKGYGELTTEDVKFSFERLTDPELNSIHAEDWAVLERVDVINRYEGRIILKESKVTFWTMALPTTSGMIICKKQYQEVGNNKFTEDIVGTGPYTYEGRSSEGNAILLKYNFDYWGKPSYFDVIELHTNSESESDGESEDIIEELDSSEISISYDTGIENYGYYRKSILPSTSCGFLGMNTDNPKLNDKNVRLAIRYSVDIPAILDNVYFGLAEQVKSIIPKGVTGYWEDAPFYERDVVKARNYLSLAGFESLELELTIEDTAEYRSWAEIIRQNLKEVGIFITIKPLNPSIFKNLDEGYKHRELELFAYTHSGSTEPSRYTQWFIKDQLSGGNWMNWNSYEFNELHKKGIKTWDTDQRSAIYIEMQKLLDEEANIIWISSVPNVFSYYNTVKPAMNLGCTIPSLRDFRVI